jgi:hypothetical protein
MVELFFTNFGVDGVFPLVLWFMMLMYVWHAPKGDLHNA